MTNHTHWAVRDFCSAALERFDSKLADMRFGILGWVGRKPTDLYTANDAYYYTARMIVRCPDMRAAFASLEAQWNDVIRSVGKGRFVVALIEGVERDISSLGEWLDALEKSMEKRGRGWEAQLSDDDWLYWKQAIISRDSVEHARMELARRSADKKVKDYIKEYDRALKQLGPRVFGPFIRREMLVREGRARLAPPEFWWYYMDAAVDE